MERRQNGMPNLNGTENGNGTTMPRTNNGNSGTMPRTNNGNGCAMPRTNNGNGCGCRGESGGGMPRTGVSDACENGTTRPHFASGSVQLASVYAPMQKWQMLFTPDKALSHGTLFEELYKPLEVSRNG